MHVGVDSPIPAFSHAGVLSGLTPLFAVLISLQFALIVGHDLIDVPGARARAESAVPPRDEAWFWRSALLIQLLHLSLPGLAPGSEFRPTHEQVRDELLARVMATSC